MTNIRPVHAPGRPSGVLFTAFLVSTALSSVGPVAGGAVPSGTPPALRATATPSPAAAETEAVRLVLGLDTEAVPGCMRRSILRVDTGSPAPAAVEDGDDEAARAAAGVARVERWQVDRCGTLVTWEVRRAPLAGGGYLLSAGLADGPPAAGTMAGEAVRAGAVPPLAVAAPVSLRPAFVVTQTGDSGPGSLAQAILDANAAENRGGPDRIVFAIPGPGPHTIGLVAALPPITDPVEIDGFTQPGAGDTERILADAPARTDDETRGPAVVLDGRLLARPADGLRLLAGPSVVRGLGLGGFAGDGIRIEGSGFNRIEGNRIGALAADGGSEGPDEGLAGNGAAGVRVTGAAAIGNVILGNRIAGNGEDGIVLDVATLDRADRAPGPGPNRGQRAPELASMSFTPAGGGRPADIAVSGSLEGRPGISCTVELFATRASGANARPGAAGPARGPVAEGDRLLATTAVTPGADGRVGFEFHLPAGVHTRDLLTATATDDAGNTSEFSQPIQAAAILVSWNAGTGNWNTPGNWSPPQVPATGDDVIIAANGVNTTFTVTLNVNSSLNTLSLGGGSGTQTLAIPAAMLTLGAASVVNAAGTLSLSGGTITGTGALTIDGTFNWSGGLMSGVATTNVNGPFNLSGVVEISARTLNNNSTAVWTAASGHGVRTGGGSIINNNGTWDSSTDGVVIIHYFGGTTTFNNPGVFRRSAGTGTTTIGIPFNNTGTLDVQTGTVVLYGGTSTGAFAVSSASSLLVFGSSTHNLNAGATFAGPGAVRVNANGGTVNVNAAVSIPAATTLDFLLGTLGGTGTLTIEGPFNWSGGQMAGAGGVTNVNGPFNLSGVVELFGRTLNNNSTAVWTAGNGQGVRTGGGSIINNNGTWDSSTDGVTLVHYFSGATTFNNPGVFRKSAGTGITTIGIPFNNTGTLDVQTGTIVLYGGASTGAFAVSSAPSLIVFGSGTYALNTGTTFTGPGTVRVNTNGTVSVNGPISTPAATTVEFLAGTLGGTGTLTINGPFNWSGGLMTNAGVTTLNGPFNLSGVVELFARTINANGTTTWTSASGQGVRTGGGSIINNNGTWEAQTDGGAIVVFYSGGTSFRNAGTFRKSAGSGTASVSIPFTNTGTVDAQIGTINLSSSGYTQTAGVTRVTGGTITSTTNLSIQGGTIAGSGTITAPIIVSGTGALAPGLSPGMLNIAGNYTQQTGTAYNLEVGGTTAGTQFDQMNVGAPATIATLAGNLNVSLSGGYVPVGGETYTVMTYPSRSGALTLNAATIGCVGWQLTHGSTAAVLSAVTLPMEISGLQFAADNVTMSWDPPPPHAGTVFDALRGNLDRQPLGQGTGVTCLAQGLTATTTSDAAIPAVGQGYWYLVRERVAGCGVGTYGRATSGIERVSLACP